jgi:hypothetical protein
MHIISYLRNQSGKYVIVGDPRLIQPSAAQFRRFALTFNQTTSSQGRVSCTRPTLECIFN